MAPLTRDQVRRVDRIAIEKYQVPGIVLMENAARGASEVALEMVGARVGQYILIFCGGGNNGGDGLAMARHLHNRGHQIMIALCTDAAKYQGDALINWRVVEAMKIAARPWEEATSTTAPPQLIVDAIFGTGLSDTPRPPFGEIVERITAMGRPVLAVDIPSGLDCDSGRPFGPCIRANRTVTFVGPKVGFSKAEAREYVGEVNVVDIGCPREAIEEARRI
jgi:NAD(P)H-hydrate epimerase